MEAEILMRISAGGFYLLLYLLLGFYGGFNYVAAFNLLLLCFIIDFNIFCQATLRPFCVERWAISIPSNLLTQALSLPVVTSDSYCRFMYKVLGWSLHFLGGDGQRNQGNLPLEKTL